MHSQAFYYWQGVAQSIDPFAHCYADLMTGVALTVAIGWMCNNWRFR